MMQSPKSLTAVVYVRFNYEEARIEPPGKGDVEMLNNLMDRASALDPQFQEILVKFGDYLRKAGEPKKTGQNPS